MKRMLRQTAVGGLAVLMLEGALPVWSADPPTKNGTFASAGSMGYGLLGAAATLLPDGRAFVVGSDGWESVARIWEPLTADFSVAGSFATVDGFYPMEFTATPLPDGRIVVVSRGPTEEDTLTVADMWDPATDTFGPTVDIAPQWMAKNATLLPDGRLLIMGHDASLWDPATGSLTTAGSLQGQVPETVTALLDGRILAIGVVAADAMTVAHVWDPATGAFTPAGSLPGPRRRHTATRLADGRVLVVGGEIGGGREVSEADVWDATSMGFQPTGAMAEGRFDHTATGLPDGRVVVIGGLEKGGIVMQSAEVWDPNTGTFTHAGELAEARAGHSATALLDGRVLVVGGDGGPHLEAPASAELWTP